MSTANAQATTAYDFGLARAYLKLLDPTAEFFTFQTFDDVRQPDGKPRGDKTLARIFHGPLDDAMAAQLAALNALGAGIFVTVNATDGKGRTKENIGRVRAVWIDWDAKDGKPRVVVPPLMASLIVETSPAHTNELWFVDQLMPAEHAGIMQAMVEKFGSDKNAVDLPRVLRLPGYLHMKNPSSPHRVRIIGGTEWPPGFDTGERYSREQMLKAFGYEPKPEPAPTPPREPGAFDRAKPFQALGFIPAEDRKVWTDVGMALHHESGGSFEGKELWLSWSPNAPEKFDEKDLERVWKSFTGRTDRPITVGTLYKMARDNGWREPRPDPLAGFDEVEQPAGAEPKQQQKDELVVVSGEDIEMKNVEWLWPNRIARGKPNILAGDQGLGKTTLLLDTMARITRGAQWPCGEGRAPKGTVIYLGVEDALDDTIAPRFLAAGGDLTRLKCITSVNRADGNGKRSFSLKADLPQLEALINKYGDVPLVVIDPLNSYFADADTYRTSEVRAILEPVAEMAARLNVTVWGNSHLSKDGKGRSANLRILDSQAITAIARGISLVAPDPSDPERQLFMRSKGSNSKRGLPALAYTIREKLDVARDKKGQPINATYLDWASGSVALSADEVFGQLEQKGRATPAQDDAKEFLREFLADGPRLSTDVQAAAKAHSISGATLRRAREELGVLVKNPDWSGKWTWELPPARAPESF